MFGIGTGEMVVIAVIAVLILGPERCIESFRKAGKILRHIRAEWADAKSAIDEVGSPPPQPPAPYRCDDNSLGTVTSLDALKPPSPPKIS